MQQVRDPEEVGDVHRRRLLVHLPRSAALLDLPGIHDREAVAHRERLLLIVGDVHERDADLPLQRDQLELQGLAQLRVERTERLVEQQHPGPQDERAGERHALLLPA